MLTTPASRNARLEPRTLASSTHGSAPLDGAAGAAAARMAPPSQGARIAVMWAPVEIGMSSLRAPAIPRGPGAVGAGQVPTDEPRPDRRVRGDASLGSSLDHDVRRRRSLELSGEGTPLGFEEHLPGPAVGRDREGSAGQVEIEWTPEDVDRPRPGVWVPQQRGLRPDARVVGAGMALVVQAAG